MADLSRIRVDKMSRETGIERVTIEDAFEHRVISHDVAVRADLEDAALEECMSYFRKQAMGSAKEKAVIRLIANEFFRN